MEFLAADSISKSYGSVSALKSVSFRADAGKITGLIGPDGAGKSSLMKIILGLITADSGMLYLDHPNTDFLHEQNRTAQRQYVRTYVGYMPEVFSLYTDLSVEENLRFSHRIHRGDPGEYAELTERLYRFNRLSDFSRTRAGALSGGMKQKLALSCALMHSPKMLILDEPTTGVDPLSRKEFWSMLKELKEREITIIVSTPYMEEAVMCDRVSLFHRGQVLDSGTPSELVSSFPGILMETPSESEAPQELKNRIQGVLPRAHAYLAGRKIRIFLAGGAESGHRPGEAAAILEEHHIPPCVKVDPGLEDLFLARVFLEDSGD